MAHTLQKLNVGDNALAVIKITDYVQGGEAFTLAELGLTGSLSSLIFLVNPTADPIPVFVAPNLVKLFPRQSASMDPASPFRFESPSQVGINYVFAAIVQGVN